MAALQYVNDPDYSALLLRRTYADLSLPGALMDRANQWLMGTSAKWNGNEKQWTFPSGAKIQFGYMEAEKDKYRYQGAEFQFVGFDELTQFSETQYKYLISRLRRLDGVKVPLRIRAATNPGGFGHKWVFKRFVDPTTSEGRIFVPARLEDNPHLNQDEYRESLALLDEVTRRQLMEGEWIDDTTGLIYKMSAHNLIDSAPDDLLYILSIDLGAAANDATTAFCLLGYAYHRKQVYCIKSWTKAGMFPSAIADVIHQVNRTHPLNRIIMDAGALGAGYVREMNERHSLPAEPARKQDKAGYRKLLNGDLEQKRLLIVKQDNVQLIEEMGELLWDAKGRDSMPGMDDHVSDALLYGWREARHWLSIEAAAIPQTKEERDRAMENEMVERFEAEWLAKNGEWWDA